MDFTPTPCQKQRHPDGYPSSTTCLFPPGSSGVGARQPQRSSLPLLNGVAPLPLLPSQEDVGSGAFRAPEPEGNAPPVQGRAVLPGRGRAGPVVDPHRLAPPPGAPQAQALKLWRSSQQWRVFMCEGSSTTPLPRPP